MKFNELKTISSKNSTRVGRGISAGRGKTAGRGTKGQNSRTGGGVRLGFEGGQNPLAQRLPKLPGFKAIKPSAEVVTTGQIDNLPTIIDNYTLADNGLTTSAFVKVKLVVNGKLSKKHTVTLQAASKGAALMLKELGGSFKKIEQLKRPKSKKTNK